MQAGIHTLLGQGLVLLALTLASMGAVVGLSAGRNGSAPGLALSRLLATAFGACLILANLVMVRALLVRDFTVRYVDQVGSTSVPDWIAVVSLWSALEGSILFWGFILGAYTLGFVWATRDRHREFAPYALGTLMTVGAFFCVLLAGPADPFGAVVPRPDAAHIGPNPLLQNHILMVVHPPMLYLGYVGMSIPFSMGVAALLRGRLGAGWMRPMRRWMLLPWGFLTVGIVLGGWWAYEVLGWGGYWAWDPVENASFLPWLTASAFLHAAMLEERRGVLKGWTLVLLLATFALTILGTFMTRSGVFNSVHSFTQSAIGPTFLVFLAAVLLGSVLLLGFRMHLLVAEGAIRSPISRESAFIVNNLLFVAFTFTVLVGTVFPLLAEAVRGVKVSVGEPFFNQLAVPVAVGIVFLMGVGPALPWGRADGAELRGGLLPPLGAGLLALAGGVTLGVRAFWPALTLFVAAFAGWVSLRDMAVPVLARRRATLAAGGGGGWPRAAWGAFVRGRRRYGGQVVHVGVALMAVAIALSSSYQKTWEGVLDKGGSVEVGGGYSLTFQGSRHEQQPHREVISATLLARHEGRELGTLEPSMNRYNGQMSPIGTPAVRSGPFEDLYLSIMQVDDGGKWVGLRVFVNPMVGWIWVAAAWMVVGCLLAAWPSRADVRAAAPAAAAGAGATAALAAAGERAS